MASDMELTPKTDMRNTTVQYHHSGIALGDLLPATFVRRDNRFRIVARLGEEHILAHLADPGRLRELLISGCTVWLRAATAASRKTAYDAVLVEAGSQLVSIHTQLPNALVGQALGARLIPGLDDFTTFSREVRLDESRIDFCLADDQGRHWVEVKSVTLVLDGVARFPDAPTLRGRRHLRALQMAVASGDRATVLFVIQRADTDALRPNDETDPAFGLALRQAWAAGVNIRALSCQVTPQRIVLRPSPVRIDLSPGV